MDDYLSGLATIKSEILSLFIIKHIEIFTLNVQSFLYYSLRFLPGSKHLARS